VIKKDVRLFQRQTVKTLYLEIFSGISGDMLIGALIDLGADAHRLEQELGNWVLMATLTWRAEQGQH
jgi:uncharacterized protein (DUF111 family)